MSIKTQKNHTLSCSLSKKIMRILHFILILAVSILLKKNVYCDSSSPLPNASHIFQVVASDIQLDDERRGPTPPPPPPPPPPKVTAYLMVVGWPPGICSGSKRCLIPTVPTDFKIHGLWPQFPSDDPPAFKTYDPQTLVPLFPALKESWLNLFSQGQLLGDYFAFWSHEWKDHGGYSEMEGLAYFSKALELFRADGQGLKAKLAAEQIKPGATYTLVQLNTALKKINSGFSCTVRCVPGNLLQLQEIRFRYNRNFQKQNNYAGSNCGTNVRFPA